MAVAVLALVVVAVEDVSPGERYPNRSSANVAAQLDHRRHGNRPRRCPNHSTFMAADDIDLANAKERHCALPGDNLERLIGGVQEKTTTR